MIYQIRLFSPKEQKEMGQYIECLERAAVREIQATPQRREEITDYYQSQIDRYISERRSEKNKKVTIGLLLAAVCSAVFLIIGLTAHIRFLTFVGVVFFVTCLVNAIRSFFRI